MVSDEHLHSELKVDTWKLVVDKKENYIEEYDGKRSMEEVDQIKYLVEGCVKYNEIA